MRSPHFPVPTADISPTDFYRNYWCSQYGICLKEAAYLDLLLDCGDCKYENSIHPDMVSKTALFWIVENR
jgi:hypothetical protein